jgi:hypothetical protein
MKTPTTSPTNAPTMAPPTPPACFSTTDEVYVTVDKFLLNEAPTAMDELEATYGLPMGT